LYAIRFAKSDANSDHNSDTDSYSHSNRNSDLESHTDSAISPEPATAAVKTVTSD
jgi:hypothetical protein